MTMSVHKEESLEMYNWHCPLWTPGYPMGSIVIMVVQSLENLEKREKSGNRIFVKENLEKSGNFTERAKNVIGYCAFSY